MNNLAAGKNRRVLIIDDNRAIHEDFRKILCPATVTAAALAATEAALFGGASDAIPPTQFEIDSAYQGQEGVLLAAKALEAGRPYAMAFVDVRMPPGWDGVETTGKLWELDPNLQVVICTAYSDYSWGEMFEELGQCDGLLILKKPFDSAEAFQLAHALTEKWWLHQESRRKMEELESRVAGRTHELEQTNQRITNILESITDGFVALDKEWRFVFVNRRANEILQQLKPRERLLGVSHWEAFPDALGTPVEQHYRRAMQEQVTVRFEFFYPALNAWIDIRVFPSPDGLAIYFQDITESKRAAEALHQSQERFRLLVEASPDAIGIHQAGKLVFINSSGLRQLGAKTQEELLGRKSEQIIHPADLAAANDRMRRGLAGETGLYPAEVRYLRLDGTTVPVEVSAAPITLDGKPATQFIARDITERKQIETSLRASRANLAAAQRIAHFGSWELELTNPYGIHANELRWSDEMFRIAGYEPGAVEVTNELFFSLVHPDDREPIRQAVAAAIRERRHYSIVHRLIRADGEARIVHETAEILFDEKTGRPVKIVGTAHDITAQRKAEEALRESEERFASAFEHAPIGVALVSPDGQWLKVNRTLSDLVGYSEAELLTRTFQDITHPDDLEGDLENVRRLIAGEISSYQMEKRYVHKRGHLVTVLLDVSLVRDGQGRPRYFISQIQDITARKQADEVLRQTEALYRRAITGAGAVPYASDYATRSYIFMGEGIEPLIGYAPHEVTGQLWKQIIQESIMAGESAGLSKEEAARRMADGEIQSWRCDMRVRTRDGKSRWLADSSVQRHDAAGRPVGAMGILQDITERKRNEISALAFSKLGQRLSSVASVREAFGIISEVSRELFGWEAFCISLYRADRGLMHSGFAIDTIGGQPVAEERNEPVKPGELYRRIIERGGELIRRDPSTIDLLRIVPFGDVSRRSAVLMFVPIHSRGHVVGILSVQSYTPNAYNEADLKTLQTMADQCGGAIERIWADEALRKAEAQLFQSQKLETVGKLAGGIAHEFNSILTAIIGQSELLLADLPAGSSLAENVTEISKAAGRAATLTRQLLAYGRKQFLKPENLDLNPVLAGMESTLRHLMGRGVDVRIAPAAGLKAVKADAGQIEQVIMNLVMNAADAMPNGGKLTLETGNVSFAAESMDRLAELKPGDYVLLAITDTGAGMSEVVKARAFEPFFTTKGVGQGTGLGLSTCYGIVKQSDGHISVYSEPGRGTTFKIYLPQIEPQAKIPIQRLDPPDLPRGTETILLVEDDPALREMAATLLSRLGYKTLAAANGVEALSLQQERSTGPIDLLFTDVVMPHMNGNELADRVRALSPHTRILFTSAYPGNAIVHQGVLAHGVALLQKPFSPSALAHKLREVLDQPAPPA